jgi:hypothetical protein
MRNRNSAFHWFAKWPVINFPGICREYRHSFVNSVAFLQVETKWLKKPLCGAGPKAPALTTRRHLPPSQN